MCNDCLVALKGTDSEATPLQKFAASPAAPVVVIAGSALGVLLIVKLLSGGKK